MRYVWKGQEMFFEDYDAGLEKHCRELESGARAITGAEEKELFGKFFGQDPEKPAAEALSARDQIINAHTDLAVALATKYAYSREMPKGELVSEATFALITAVNKYNPEVKSGSFRSYAASVIIHALKKYCWEHNRMISIPRDEVRQMYAIHKAEEKLVAEFQRKPTSAELAQECGMTEKHVRRLRRIPFDVESYDRIIAGTGEKVEEIGDDEKEPLTLADQISKDEEGIHFPPSTRVTYGDSLRMLRRELRKLDRFQYNVIKYRFNLGRFQGITALEEQPLSVQDICLVLNCTRGLLIRSKYAALRKLRQEIIARFKEEFGVDRITPGLQEKVLAAERADERAGRF